MKADSKLHRAGKRPDWAKVSPRRRNFWQRLANESGGILTIGNVLTVVGLCLVLVGLSLIMMEMYWPGLVLVVFGRICDLLDGWSADLTQTKSPLGELLDSSADKFGTAVALIVLAVIEVVPWPIVFLLFAVHLAISGLILFRAKQKHSLHPSRLGKLGMAALWLGLGGFLLQLAVDGANNGAFALLGYVACVVAIGLSSLALLGYARSK